MTTTYGAPTEQAAGGKPLTNSELATFCGQLALILRSGISTLEGISIMLEDAPSTEGRALLRGILDQLEMGGSLTSGLRECGCFPEYACNMVELGEQSGRLDDVTESLAAYYRREDDLSKSIKSAVTYPMVMLGMMAAVMLVLIIKVLPVFNQVFRQLGAELTGVSGAVLRFGDAMSRYSVAFIAVAALAAAGLAWVFLSQRGRTWARNFSTRFFATRRLSEMIATGRFAGGMHLALSSGLNIDQALETVARLVEHPVVGEKVEQIRQTVAQGGSLGDAITEAGLFSGIYARMIHIGVKAGAVDEVLAQISVQYDQEIQQRMAGVVAKLEPTLVAVLSVAVGMILLSVMLPLMGIMSGIG